MHLDLKPKNILIDTEITNSSQLDFNIRICDFGLSSYDNPLKNGIWSFRGTPEYMAPEIVHNKDKNF